MRQRLGLADTLVKEPSILVLDEPAEHRPGGVRDILLLVERLRTEQGVTVLLSSHLLHQVEQVCDRIGVFVAGRLAAMGTIDQLASELTDRWRFAVGVTGLDDAPAALRTIPGVADVEREEGRWLLAADRDIRAELQELMVGGGAKFTHLTREGADLDAIYHRWFRGPDDDDDDR